MRAAKYIVCVFLITLVSGCGKHVYYKVKKGDTLYSIGWQYGKDYRQIAQWNGISPPYIIHSGEWIRVLPALPSLSTKKPLSVGKLPQDHRLRKGSSSEKYAKKVENNPDKGDRSSGNNAQINIKPRWKWPAKGDLLYNFTNSGAGKKGLGIKGRIGQPVYAAASGKVVYSGEGLVGYGNLIIIKHDDTYLSAYGHNDINFLKEGQRVNVGQKISHMGSSGTHRPLLHFEIRKNGIAVNPLQYLPRINEADN